MRPSQYSAITIARTAATRSRRAGTPTTSEGSRCSTARRSELSLSGHRVCIGGASAERIRRERGYDPSIHLDASADLRVMLCHFPDMLPRLAPGIAHLVLAGHLHGGQLCIPWPGGRLGLAHPRSGPISAIEASNGTVMHISPGIGTTFVPLRFLAQPEVTLLRLRSL